MDEELYSGYDGGFTGDGGRHMHSRKRTGIPKLPSFIKKRGRKRRVRKNSSEKTIVMWVVISFLVSAAFRAELVFIICYGVFLLYTVFSKDMNPIRLVSSVISFMGVLFFIAITLVVLLDLFGDAGMLLDPMTWKAYGFIIGVPLISRLIVTGLESWIGRLRRKQDF